MPRPLRFDRPGALHHITNRGNGQSPIYETFADVNCFTSLLAESAVRDGIEIHAYAVLSTHLHLVVRSVSGNLAAAMQSVFSLYATWFNRTRGRDGHVFKGRYHSVPIVDSVQLALTVTYDDHNAVAAEMAPSPCEYPHSSAHHYVSPNPPSWLTTGLIRDLVCRIAGVPAFRPEIYGELWRACQGRNLTSIIERTWNGRRLAVAPLELLTRAGPAHVQRWLIENTVREEGRPNPVLAVPVGVLRDVLESSPLDSLRARFGGTQRAMGRALAAGLLHTLAGVPMAAAAGMLSISRVTVCADIAAHGAALQQDPEYARLTASIVAIALRRAYGTLIAA